MGIPPRVIDLSLARTIERAQRLTEYVGTNAYMPPEQQCNPRGDVGPTGGRVGTGRDALPRGLGQAAVQARRARATTDAPLEDRSRSSRTSRERWRRPVPGTLADAILSCLEKDPASGRPRASWQ